MSKEDAKIFMAARDDLKRVCADIERAFMVIFVFDENDAPRFIKKIREVNKTLHRLFCFSSRLQTIAYLFHQVYTLLCDDEYGDWLDKPLGGRKSPFATTQLSHLLERYMATVITTSLLTQNYTAAASSKLDEIDITKAIKGEVTLDKALEKYGEAVANGTPVEMMTVLIIPEWQKPGNMPKAIEELRHSTGGAQDSSFAHGSPAKRPKNKSTRFSFTDPDAGSHL